MYDVLLTALVAVSIILIILVVLQPSKSNAASSLTGGGGEQIAKQKARGFEAFLIRATVVFGILFFVLALALTYLSSK